MASAKPSTSRAIRRYLTIGTAVTLLLAGGLGGWASTTELAGAVIAPGVLVVDTNVKKVQHPTGGVVGELRVREGDHVKAGDLVVRLDDTVLRANLAVVTKNIDELAAQQARLEAERDGRDAIQIPRDLMARVREPEVAALVLGEKRLFELRRDARAGQKNQLNERIAQLKEEISGLSEQVDAKGKEIGLIGQELQGVRELWQKNLVPFSRVTALERDAARIGGERGALVSSIAQAKGKISEIGMQILQIDQDLRTEVGKNLAEIRAKMSELAEKRVAAQDQLQRTDIRAPEDGMVHQLAVHTVGGVVNAGEPLMLIVPDNEPLAVEARIAPQDIDQVRIGHRAMLRFSAFNLRTTPELSGEVSLVSADTSQDPKTGASFYTARIAVPDTEIKRLDGLKLVPGMPVESFIRTADRTVLSYLGKPLADQFMKALRER